MYLPKVRTLAERQDCRKAVLKSGVLFEGGVKAEVKVDILTDCEGALTGIR